MSVTVASWAGSMARGTMAGSIYAVDEDLRLEAARALHACGHGIHADVIVRDDGTHRGVVLRQIADLRREPALGDATIDIHLIVEGDARSDAAERAVRDVLAVAFDIRAVRVSLSEPLLSAWSETIQDARARGMEVWAEMPSRGAAPPPADVDGCLVMLIPPGTVLDADPAGVGVVQGLSTSMPVAVDGGVTAELAARCAAAGAEWIVSGRALLTISNHRKESEDVV